MAWQISSPGIFYDRDETVVVYYDAASGNTHLISEFAAYLIQQIASQDRPLDSDEIIKLVSSDIEPGNQTELNQTIPQIIGELATLDIVAQA